ncbi:chromosome segregation protein SMC [[Clostridium] cellulosi]
MYLKSLEIQGFKSFPDKTLLKFEKGITAVVGPNGSGKSNISDAIRWVLGEVSSKALRGTKMEDVIFGGTVDRRPLGFAEVSLTLDNTERRLPYDSDEVKITRRCYRSGESEYLICGKSVRLKDIHELLMDTGLGRDGYSIIGQGRIDEIVSAKSEDRRQIFEEAAGISKYRSRKEESERRLAETEENLVRLRDILAELESRVGPLKEQAEKAKKYIELAGEKKNLEIGLWLNNLDKQRSVLREHENRLEYARAQYDAVNEKLEAAQAKMEAVWLESQKKAAQIEQLRREARELYETAIQKQSQTGILQNDINHNTENIERLNDEIKKAESSGDESETEMARINAEIEKKLAEAEEIEKRLTECENGVTDISKQSEGLSGELERAAAELSALTIKLSDIRVEKNGAVASIAHLKERSEAIDGEIAAREQRLSEAKSGLKEAEARLSERDADIETLSNEQRGYELKLNSKKDKLSRIDESIRSFTLQYEGKKQRAAMLEDMERSLEGFSQSVKTVMREKAYGRLSGIHAPVSKIIDVPAEYALAIETALGFSAQHIVVDTEENAKAAIGMLKRTNGGRATFLPISSVHGNILSERGLESESGFIGIASELISFDNKYQGIIRSLLGRTALAKDLDCAVRIARKYNYRFRIVTLDGQLVNAGGSMTGGSTSKNIGLLSRSADIAKLRKEAEAIKQRIDALTEERKTHAQQYSALEASVLGIKGELATAQEDKIRIEAEKRRFEEQIAQINDEIAALKREKEESAHRIAEYEKKAAENDEAIKAITLKIEEEQRKTEDLGISRTKLMRMREERTEKLAALRLEKVTCEKDIEALRQELNNIILRRQSSEDRIKELKLQIAELNAKSEQARADIQRLKNEEEELRRLSEEKTKAAAELAEEREKMERDTADMRANERDLSDEKEKISEELARLEERKSTAQAEYDSIIARLLDEYDMTRSQAEKTVPKIENPAQAQRRLNEVKNSIKALGTVNVGAIEEYKEVNERYTFMKTQTDDVEKSKRELEKLIAALTDKMRDIFKEQLEIINKNFSETFVELFGGGSAHLELTEPEDVLNSGIDIIVQPPGKIIKNLSMLSGGERAFVAIALYFAILKVRPSPFCVLDEIEAALDDANVSRFSAYLRRMCGNTQFIVITHRRGTMDEADVLYGVTMQDEGVSKLLTLDVDELVEKLGLKN